MPVQRSPLAFARIVHGLTQQELADKVGITREQVSRLERGDQRTRLRTAQAIAAALDSTVEVLFPSDGLIERSNPSGKGRSAEA